MCLSGRPRLKWFLKNSVARSEFTAATSVPSPTDLPHGELTVQATDIFPAQRLPFDVLLFTTSWIDDDDVISLGRTCHALQAPAYKLYLCRQRILTGRATRMFSGEIITSIRLRASLPAIALRIFSSYSTLKDLGRVLLECQLSLILFSPVSLVSALHGIKVTRVTIPVVPSLLINHPSAHVALIHLLSSLPPSCETIIAEDEVFNDWDEEQPSSIPTIPNPSSFSRTSTLTTLRWQSELWTASGLRNLSVQLFSAPNLQDVTLSARKFSQIAKILPSIRLPSLNTFTVCVAGPKPFHLPQVFFRRHPSLQSLTLLSQPTSYILAFEPPVQHPVLQLPALTHFRATANYGGWKMDDPSSLVCMAFDPMSPRIPPSTNHFCTAMQSLSSQMRKSLDITLQPDFMLSLTLPSRLAHHIHSKGNDFTCSCAVPAEYSITNVYNVELWVDYGGPDILVSWIT